MTFAVVLAALAADRILGEPPARWHPLVGFGALASRLENALGRSRLSGVTALIVLLAPITLLAWAVSTPLVDAALLYLAIALRSLEEHASRVSSALGLGNLEAARTAVARIVSRDTLAMSEEDVARAGVESVLENGNDAVFGALFWFVVAGAPGAVLYRLANTLDAMWGYRNETYLRYGWAAARLDDLLNLAPARLTALTYCALGATRAGLRCWRTQAAAWYSPNAGPVMAAGAGALGVELGGAASYGGRMKERPLLGCGARPGAGDIERAVRLVKRGVLAWMALIGTTCAAQALAVEATDQLGHRVRLERPAARIVSFAPHLTELLFAIGAGERIVGVVKHSDYPQAAKRIPQVGDNTAADLERIVALRPDLIVAWLHGSALKQLERLRSTGIPVYYSNPQTLEAIAREGETIALLAGTSALAAAWAREFRERHRRLLERYAAQPRVSVFYQVWGRPLYTLNREHFVSDLLATCGALNVFGALPLVAPVVDVEAVLKANPQAIVGALSEAELRAQWSRWPQLEAVRRGNLFSVDADLTHRAGPRAIDAAEILCAKVDEARRR